MTISYYPYWRRTPQALLVAFHDPKLANATRAIELDISVDDSGKPVGLQIYGLSRHVDDASLRRLVEGCEQTAIQCHFNSEDDILSITIERIHPIYDVGGLGLLSLDEDSNLLQIQAVVLPKFKPA